MPHIIIEHSQNVVSESHCSSFIDAVFQAVLDTKLFTSDNLKVRLKPVKDFRLGLEGFEFVHVQCRIHTGRDELQKKFLTERILEALSQEITSSTVMTCEVVEMDRASYSKSIINK
ncbi:MAG: hypothetical protein OQL19_14685 [Gammaproteobacteria bacterium]|nr:hypothetical protein [Gammaproteobacteria bacterium]